ncbi:hypothetical protein HUJ04_009212 [Dendroctonus ponderosae]|nr:hypothetical protein HUJ04_009212 [Dendroctonus ponderosae]
MLLSIALMIKGANSGKKLNCMAGIKVFACVHLTIKSAVGCTWYPFPPIMSGSTLMDHNTTHITYPFIFNWSNVVINEAKPFSRPQTESLSNILMNLPYLQDCVYLIHIINFSSIELKTVHTNGFLDALHSVRPPLCSRRFSEVDLVSIIAIPPNSVGLILWIVHKIA